MSLFGIERFGPDSFPPTVADPITVAEVLAAARGLANAPMDPTGLISRRGHRRLRRLFGGTHCPTCGEWCRSLARHRRRWHP